MQIIVSGKHLDIGDALRSHTEVQLQHNIKKHFDHITSARVVITKEANAFKTSIIVEGLGTGVVIKGEGDDHDPYRSVDTAVKKIGEHLGRYKEKKLKVRVKRLTEEEESAFDD